MSEGERGSFMDHFPDNYDVVKICNLKLASIREKVALTRKELQNQIIDLLKTNYSLNLNHLILMSLDTNNFKSYIDKKIFDKQIVSAYSSIFEDNSVGYITLDIIFFIEKTIEMLHLLPKYLAKLKSDDAIFTCSVSFLNINFLKYLSYSAIPTLFCNLITADFKRCYIGFISEIVKLIDFSSFEELKNHWIYESFRFYIDTTDVRSFLYNSIGGIIEDIINRSIRWQEFTNIKNQEIFNDLVDILKDILVNIENNISFFPSEICLLFRAMGNSCPKIVSSSPPNSLFVSLMIDLILEPAISSPDIFGVISPTIYIHKTSKGVPQVLRLLSQLIKFLGRKDDIKSYFKMFDTSKLDDLSLINTVKRMNINEEHNYGIKYQDLLCLFELQATYHLFSKLDIIVLANLFRILVWAKLPGEFAQTISKLLLANQNLDKFSEFTVFVHNNYYLDAYRLTNSKNIEQSVNDNDMLYKILNIVNHNTSKRYNLSEFLDYHLELSKLTRDYPSLLSIEYFNKLYPNYGDKLDRLSTLEDSIRTLNCKILRYNKIHEMVLFYKEMLNEYLLANSKRFGVINSLRNKLFLRFFFYHDQTPEKSIRSFVGNIPVIIYDKDNFVHLYKESVKRLKFYFSNFNSNLCNELIMYFKSYVSSIYTFDTFCSAFPIFGVQSMNVMDKVDMIIDDIIGNKDTDGVIKAINDKNLLMLPLEQTVILFNNMFPIEFLDKFNCYLLFIKKVIKLELNKEVDDNFLIYICIYLFIKSEVKYMFAFCSYVLNIMDVFELEEVKFPCKILDSIVEYLASMIR